MSKPPVTIIDNPWQSLRQYTSARIAQGRTGVSLPTAPHLLFQRDHARARDAVHLPLDVPQLLTDLESAGVAGAADVVQLHSAAPDRLCYLQRPDLGRRLDAASRSHLAGLAAAHGDGYDVALVLADGLSALAVARQAPLLLAALKPLVAAQGWRLAPLTIVRQARVAVGDEIGALLGARLVVVMIGERPGLSSPDSLGLYLTWMPEPGLTDARRNCISNVRAAGLSPAAAAVRLQCLLAQAMRLQVSGVALKDDSAASLPAESAAANFLLPATEPGPVAGDQLQRY